MRRVLIVGITLLLATDATGAAPSASAVWDECEGTGVDEGYPDAVVASGQGFSDTTHERLEKAVDQFNGKNVVVTNGLGPLAYDRNDQTLSGEWMGQAFEFELEAVKGGSNRDTFVGGPGNKVGLRETKMPNGGKSGASTIAQIALAGIFEGVDTSCWSEACKACLQGATQAAQACELKRQIDLDDTSGGDDGIGGGAIKKDRKKLCKAADEALEECADCAPEVQGAIPNPDGGGLSCASCGT